MAFKRRLEDGWQLTDGIFGAFPIGAARNVADAAAAAGYAADPAQGMALLRDEWIYSRRWEYSTVIDAPEEGDERVYLFFDELSGSGEVLLNGESAGTFEGGECQIDITGRIREGKNELAVRFEPVLRCLPGGNPMPKLGITGGVWLKTGNYMTLEKSFCRVSGNDIVIEHSLTAHTAGKYTFSYVVSLDGELIEKADFTERLSAARAALTHVISIKDPVPFDRDRQDETIYDVRLTVQRNQIGCETARFEAVFGQNLNADRILVTRESALTPEMARDMLALGAGGVILAGRKGEAREGSVTRFGMPLLAADAAPTAQTSPACVSADTVKAETAGLDKAWPVDAPVWKLRGAGIPDVEALKRKYGQEAGEQGAAVLLSRFEQAVSVRQAALEARQNGVRAAFEWDMPWDGLCGSGLTERGGRHRPAWEALKQGWQDECVWCDQTGSAERSDGGLRRIPIYAVTEEETPRLVNVSAKVMNPEGDIVTAGSYPLMLARGTTRAGVLTVDMPQEDRVLVLRLEITNGIDKLFARHDDLIFAEGCGLKSLKQASLRRVNGKIKNVGQVAALSVECVLMPGEETDMEPEWLNAGSVENGD